MQVPSEVFERLVDRALDEIPPALTPYLENVIIEIEDVPDRRTCASVGVSHPHALLGLYHGIPLTQQSVQHSGRMPDRISLYKTNIERICRSHDELVAQIRKTVLHEVGHHFGLDEDDLDELGYG